MGSLRAKACMPFSVRTTDQISPPSRIRPPVKIKVSKNPMTL